MTVNAGKQSCSKKAQLHLFLELKVNINGTQDVDSSGSTVEWSRKTCKSQSQATDEKQASFLGQLMSAIKKFKQLLECAAG